MKKLKNVVIFALSLTIFAMALTGCNTSFDHFVDGINEDTRSFGMGSDDRKFGDAPDYQGFCYQSGEKRMFFRLKTPETPVPNEIYPMVIFLHGSGDWGTDNVNQMYRSLITSVEKYVEEECYVFFPQTAEGEDWTHEDSGAIYNELLKKLLEIYPVDRARVYLTGMSMGGFGTIYQGIEHNELYAALMPLCGFMPEDYDLSALSDTPVYLGHSEDDPSVSVLHSRYAYAELRRLGNQNVKATFFAAEGHQVTQAFYDRAEVWEWLFAFRNNRV